MMESELQELGLIIYTFDSQGLIMYTSIIYTSM
jgi:hypothetical protein